jgi:ABC-type branched-subunit amino acid transport system ATPase component
MAILSGFSAFLAVSLAITGVYGVGPNGAGKATTMECIEGLRKPDRMVSTKRNLRVFQ